MAVKEGYNYVESKCWTKVGIGSALLADTKAKPIVEGNGGGGQGWIWDV